MSMSPPAGSDERDRKRSAVALLVGVPAVIITMAITLLPALLIVADAYDWDGSRADATALRKPFAAAVADLRFSEGVVYGDAKYAGMSISDITVTRSGMRLGVLDFEGGGPLDGIELPGTGSGAGLGAIELLQVDGKTFFRAHDTKMPWTTGSMVDDVVPMLETFWTPSRLAEHLGALLAKAGEDDLVGEGTVPSVESIGDQSVLRADLGGNSLLVSKSEPHRIVAVIPSPVIQSKWIQKSASQPRAPVGGPDDLALVAWSSSDGDKPAFGDDGMSMDPVPAENADSMYDQFEEPINELPNAVNSDIDFNLSPSGNVSCSTGGCTVNQQIVGSVNATSPDAQVSGGQVNANMIANFTIDGGGAGSCTTSGTFPVTGGAVSGSLSCSNPGAGPIMAAAIQRKKAALGPRGGRYQVAYSARTNVTARAVVSVWVKKVRAALDKDRQHAREAAKSESEPRRVGEVLESIHDVMANPQLLKGKSPAQVEAILKDTPGWRVETLGKGSAKGRGWVFRQYTDRGNPTGQMLRWHPGGGHHGAEPYWRVKGPNGDLGGIIR